VRKRIKYELRGPKFAPVIADQPRHGAWSRRQTRTSLAGTSGVFEEHGVVVDDAA